MAATAYSTGVRTQVLRAWGGRTPPRGRSGARPREWTGSRRRRRRAARRRHAPADRDTRRTTRASLRWPARDRALRVREVQDDRDRVVAGPVAGHAEQRLDPVVVRRGAVQERRAVVVVVARVVLDGPARQRARAFPDVRLAVVADAEAKELHQLPRVVLVGPPGVVQPVVEPDEHRGSWRIHGDVVEAAQGVLPHRPVLVEHEGGAADLGYPGSPVQVPEVGHLFLQRPGRERHAVHEPLLDAADLGEVVVPRRQSGFVRGQVDRVVVHEAGDRALQAPAVEVVDLRGVPPEPARRRRCAAESRVQFTALIWPLIGWPYRPTEWGLDEARPERFT